MESLFPDVAESSLLDALNPTQREAVTTTEGPVLVVAGAGSGKTRVLTYRIAHLIRDLGVAPSSILAITFTNKAANEMKERVGKLVGDSVRSMWVSTFHSACVRILRREAHRIGYRSGFSIYDAQDSLRLITQCVAELDLDPKKFPPRSIRASISNAKNELIDVDSFRSQGSGFFHEHVADVYRLYQQRIVEASAMDFDDLLMVTVEVLTAFPEVLEWYQRRFTHIHVDEYQDTNHAQYELVRLLGAAHRNVCVVGDSDQSIYAFRGADIRNILSFEDDYPEATVIKLEQNYRSTQVILEAANAVIANNTQRIPKRLWSAGDRGLPITRFSAEDEHDEASFIVDKVREHVAAGRPLSDIAVFYRTNAQSRVIEDVFMRTGTTYVVVGGVKFYERREVRDAVAYLRVLVNPDDQLSLKRVLNVPKRSIGPTSVAHLDRFAQAKGITFYEALMRADEVDALTARARRGVAGFVQLVAQLRNSAQQGGPSEAMRAVLEDTGLLDAFAEDGNIEALGRVENLRELAGVVEEYEESMAGGLVDDAEWDEMGGLARLEHFLETVSLVAETDELGDAGAVTLMTIHNAKGLEYPVVFLVGLEDGVFPHSRSLGDPKELEEERRLAYVGLTRAEERLYLTNASRRMLFGGVNHNPPSRFLDEIPDDHVEHAGPRRRPRRSTASHRTWDDLPSAPRRTVTGEERKRTNTVSFAEGDRVMHERWGPGIIREVTGSGDRAEALVLFERAGQKRLLLAYAPLSLEF
jgi:DNA helicase-2/ATP-dependent DNA helicase PcrA